jgi:DNA polymerase Ligase (LigD)
VTLPRYVVLEHTGTATYKPGRHWDLMLETGQALRTWELDSIPMPGGFALAVSLADHRLAYLDYEGPISGDRGTVRRWDWGDYEVIRESPSELDIRLNGRQLQGDVRLVRDLTNSADGWQMVFEPSK